MKYFFVYIVVSLALHTSIFAQSGQEPVRSYKLVHKDTVYTKVDIDAEYRGGQGAWLRFLQKNLYVPQSVVDNEFAPSVTVKFIVYKSGKIGPADILTKTDTAWGNTIKKLIALSNGQWLPAISGGKKVNSYKIQPVIICVSSN